MRFSLLALPLLSLAALASDLRQRADAIPQGDYKDLPESSLILMHDKKCQDLLNTDAPFDMKSSLMNGILEPSLRTFTIKDTDPAQSMLVYDLSAMTQATGMKSMSTAEWKTAKVSAIVWTFDATKHRLVVWMSNNDPYQFQATDTSVAADASKWNQDLKVKKDGQDLHFTCMDLPNADDFFTRFDFYDL